MLITCESILKLPYFEKMRLVAGKGGINKVIRWIHVVESPQVSEWVKGGELLFITGVVIKNDVNILLKFVNDLIDRNLSGLVINTGPYIKETPREVKELADKFDFPIFELPFEVKLIDVTQSISRAIFMNKVEHESMHSFMKEIIMGDSLFTDEILNRASNYGYNSNKIYCALVVDIDNFKNFIKEKKINEEDTIIEIKQNIEQIVLSVMNKWNRKVLYVIQGDSIILMMPIREVRDKYDGTAAIGQDIIKSVQEKLKNLTVSIGIGNKWSELRDFRKSVNQAQKALKIIKICGEKSSLKEYKKLGIYRIFFDGNRQSEMKEIYYETLGKLIDYDLKNETNLVKTLEAYLSEGANLGKTAEKLFIHRNTMKYRMSRMEEILQCNLRDINTLFDFNEALKIGKFLKYI
ncbi:PucR family transcriptional regulator [Clostridium pasteurianum]|uniref:Purine catabolism regulator-like protein n=1 Tax=Clostridium pasteurianum BC1 TaxID=86416 RepID=R4K2X0_CLOPA|nr:PucR family transcriptional regulator ligand-binding domain-containing protein [Clostridium pasteurianum]AGK96056.1 purine catabolism regulator-like protein [Clostridium pasteurianum BC1]